MTTVAEDPTNLNPMETTDLATDTIASLWAQGLVALNSQQQPEPELATSWKVSPDGKTYTFTLRKGVLWQDGQKFTCADVQYTLMNLLQYYPSGQQLQKVLSNVSCPSPTQAVIQLNSPYSALLASLNDADIHILPKHIYDQGDPLKNAANLHPIGTGPFEFKSWAHGQKLVFVRNPHYWDAPKPYLNEVIVDEIPNAATAVNALLTGEVNSIPTSILPSAQINQIKANNSVRLLEWNGDPTMQFLFLNTQHGPLQNVAVRKALYQAIDRNTIVKAAFSGHSSPAVEPIPPAMTKFVDPSINFEKMYPYDPTKAAAELTQAGYPLKNGNRFNLNLAYATSITPSSEVASIVKSELAQIGVTVTLSAYDFATWTKEVYPDRNYDLAYITYTAREDPALGVDRMYLCQQPSAKILFTNPTGYCNPQLDSLLNEALSTTSSSKEKSYYDQAQQIIANELPVLMLGNQQEYQVISKKFAGYQSQFDFFGAKDPNWADVWIPKGS